MVTWCGFVVVVAYVACSVIWRLELDHPGNSRGAVYGVNAEVSEGKIVPRQKINVDSYASKVLR
jgi:hypothetical protein